MTHQIFPFIVFNTPRDLEGRIATYWRMCKINQEVNFSFLARLSIIHKLTNLRPFLKEDHIQITYAPTSYLCKM